MPALVSQITSLTIIYSTVYSSCRSKKTSKLRVTGLCARNSSVTGEFPAQMLRGKCFRLMTSSWLSVFCRHWDGPGGWIPHGIQTRLSLIIDMIAVGGLATQGARASAAMVLASFARNIPDSGPEWVKEARLSDHWNHSAPLYWYIDHGRITQKIYELITEIL